jgi:hypothetical protein
MTSPFRVFGRRQTSAYSPEPERRDSPRQDTSVGAHIVTPGGKSIRCCIVNISASGALLMVPTAGLPAHFDLRDNSGRMRRVQVVRRETSRVAVQFLSPAV